VLKIWSKAFANFAVLGLFFVLFLAAVKFVWGIL